MSNPRVQELADMLNAEKTADKIKSDLQAADTKKVTDKAVKDLGGTVVSDIVDKQVSYGGPVAEAKPSSLLEEIGAGQKAERDRIDAKAADQITNANKLAGWDGK